MTPERAKMLEAVAEEARALFDGSPVLPLQALAAAIDALDALPAEPADAEEMVEVRAVVLMSRDGKDWTVGGSDAWNDDDAEMMMRELLEIKEYAEVHAATIIARIPRPVVPEVRAEVET